MLVLGRFEEPHEDDRPAPAAWRPLAAAVCVVAGLAVVASTGVVGADGPHWWWPLLPVLGLAVFGVLGPPRAGDPARRSGGGTAEG